MNRPAQHTGRVGDVYEIESEASNQRAGHSDKNVQLQVGDLIVRRCHSGDCFSHYIVIRSGSKIGVWCGYDTGKYRYNVVDELLAVEP